MTNTPRTVFTVADRFLEPVLASVPDRPTVKGLYDSLPGFAGSGGVCGVAVGVFADRDDSWRVAFFDDLVCGGVAGPAGLSSWLHTESGEELVRKAFESLPEWPQAPGSPWYLEADERGVLEPGQECAVYELEEVMAGPRQGTGLIELAFDHGDHVHFPEGVLAFVDDERGRHLLVLDRQPDRRWRLWWDAGDLAQLGRLFDVRAGKHA